jgi:hypothetical protein
MITNDVIFVITDVGQEIDDEVCLHYLQTFVHGRNDTKMVVMFTKHFCTYIWLESTSQIC